MVSGTQLAATGFRADCSRWQWATLSLLALLLQGGCAMQKSPADTDPGPGWEQRKHLLGQLHSWDLSARIAVQLDNDGGSASLQWRQEAGDYVIRIIGPLGKGTLELQGNREGVSMRDTDNRLQFAGDPETLVRAYLGWQVPISGLRWWIRGLPDPDKNIDSLSLDSNASIAKLSQGGWQITYDRYRQQQGLRLPEKLQMQNARLKVKLQIKKWILLP